MRLKVLATAALAVLVVVGALLAAYTYLSSPYSVVQSRSIGANVTVSGNVPRDIKAIETKTPGAPFTATETLSPVIQITPAGKLPAALTLRLKLSRQLRQDEIALIAVSETEHGPWMLVQSATSKDGWYVTAQTDHLSFWQALWYNLKQGIDYFKKALVDGLSGDLTTMAEKPHCDNEETARQDGYTITSSAKDTLYWCFGIENGVRVLKVVNHMRYPLEVSHPGLIVKSYQRPKIELDQLARLVSGQDTILYPFDEVDYTAEVAPGKLAVLDTTYSGLTQSLYQLQVGVTTLVNVLTRFGLESPVLKASEKAGDTFAQIVGYTDKFLQINECTKVLFDLDAGKLISGCFSPAEVVKAFGWKGFLLAPIMAVGSLLEFFRSEFDSIVGLIKGQDKYRIIVGRFDLSPYIGRWGHHDYLLTIHADGTGTDDEDFGFSPECGNTRAFRHGTLKFTPESGYAIGVYTSVTYDSCLPSSSYDIHVGDSFKLTPESYDRLLLTWLGTPPNDFFSTLWLCGPNTPWDVNIDGVCGA